MLPVAFLPLAMIIVLEHFLIAKGRVIYAYVFIAFAPVKVLIAYYYVKDATDLSLLIGSFGMVLCVGISSTDCFRKIKRDDKR